MPLQHAIGRNGFTLFVFLEREEDVQAIGLCLCD